MKTRRMATVMLLACALSFATSEALAFYNQQTGHWLSRDPSGESDTPNLYLFVHNSSLLAIDGAGKRSISTVGAVYANVTYAINTGNQLNEWTASLLADKQRFKNALFALCPFCGRLDFTSLNGRKQECTPQKCIVQATALAEVLFKNYRVVFATEYNKFGNILAGGWKANDRADHAPFHGMISQDYDKGFGLKCAGWRDLTTVRFVSTIQPFYANGSQCFRAAMVGKPEDGTSWINHAWVVIYGPGRGQLNVSMYKKGDYDIVVDPWPSAGALIINRHPYEAKRLDQPLLW